MSGRGNGGGISAPGRARPASLDSTSEASADATMEEDPLRNVDKEIEEKSCSAPTSPSKVLGVGKNSAPTSPSKVLGVGKNSAPPSPSKVLGVGKNSAPPSPSKVLGVGKNSAPTSPSKVLGVGKNSAPPSPSKVLSVGKNSAPTSPSKVLGVGKNSAPSPRSAARTPREQVTVSDVAGTSETVPGMAATDETRSEQQPVAHTRSEFAAVIQEAAAADAQGPKAASAEMEQAMTGLLDPSLKKVEPPKLPCDFATKCPSSDADPLHGGVMDDPVILSSGYADPLHGGVMDNPVISSSGYFTESSDYQVENDSMLDKLLIMGSAGETDPMEELFHSIKSLKDEYLYKLMELDRVYTVPYLTEGDKTEEFYNRVRTKTAIREVLKFLQVEKRNVHEGLKKKLPKYKTFIESLMSVGKNESHELLLQTMCWKEQQQQEAQSADASPSFPINSPEGQVRREGADTLVAKNPSDRLLYAVRSSSPAALRSSVGSMWSVLRESNSVPLGAFLDWTQQLGGSSTMNKLKRVFDHSSPTQSPLFGSMDDCGMPFEGNASDSESSGLKRQKMQNANYTVLEEIEAINSTLIDTEITIAGDSRTDRITSSSDAGTTIKLSYTAVSLSPDLKLLFRSSEKCVVMPAKLSVPSDYPRKSPMLIIDEGDDLRKKSSTISDSVHAAFPLALKDLPEPHSIKDIARAWDTCVRMAVTEFAQQYGGGTFSSRFGPWERCVSS